MVELGLIIVLFVTLTFGVIEFGRAWMIANMLTHAARDGARAAAIEPMSLRDSNGYITNASDIKGRVLTQISTVMDISNISSVDVCPPDGGCQVTVNTIPTVTVTINGSVPLATGFFGANFPVARSVTFRDEGR